MPLQILYSQFSALHRSLSFATLSLAIGTGLSLTALFSPSRAFAANQVVLKYQSLQGSLSVKELATFASTGNASAKLADYMKLAQANSSEFRQSLGNEVKVSSADLDQFLNSWFGKIILDEMSQIIRPATGQSSKQALRSAIALSTKDNKVSFLEVLQNYPATEVEIDIDRLIETDKRINAVSSNLRFRTATAVLNHL